MQYTDFMLRIQEYYGPYVQRNSKGEIARDKEQNAIPTKVKDFVFAYIKKEINENSLDRLFRFIAYSHPVNYGPPDIAAIEKAINEGIKNNKGSDVHKIPEYTTGEINPRDKEEYNEEAAEQYSKGELMNGFKKILKEKNVKRMEVK